MLGHDTVTLNWNQVQKRIRALIDNGQYLNDQEKAYLPAYETAKQLPAEVHTENIHPA